MNIDNIQSALDTARFLFDETAFTVQYLMQKLEYLLKYNFIHKNDKILFGKIGGQELYYINDIIGTEITKIDYDKTSRIFMMFLNQNYKNVNDSEGLKAYKDNGFGLYGQKVNNVHR